MIDPFLFLSRNEKYVQKYVTVRFELLIRGTDVNKTVDVKDDVNEGTSHRSVPNVFPAIRKKDTDVSYSVYIETGRWFLFLRTTAVGGAGEGLLSFSLSREEFRATSCRFCQVVKKREALWKKKGEREVSSLLPEEERRREEKRSEEKLRGEEDGEKEKERYRGPEVVGFLGIGTRDGKKFEGEKYRGGKSKKTGSGMERRMGKRKGKEYSRNAGLRKRRERVSERDGVRPLPSKHLASIVLLLVAPHERISLFFFGNSRPMGTTAILLEPQKRTVSFLRRLYKSETISQDRSRR